LCEIFEAGYDFFECLATSGKKEFLKKTLKPVKVRIHSCRFLYPNEKFPFCRFYFVVVIQIFTVKRKFRNSLITDTGVCGLNQGAWRVMKAHFYKVKIHFQFFLTSEWVIFYFAQTSLMKTNLYSFLYNLQRCGGPLM